MTQMVRHQQSPHEKEEQRACASIARVLHDLWIPEPVTTYLVGSASDNTSAPRDYDFVVIAQTRDFEHQRTVHAVRDAVMMASEGNASARLFNVQSLPKFAMQDGIRLYEFQLRNKHLGGPHDLCVYTPVISMESAFVSTAIHVLYWTVLALWRNESPTTSRKKIEYRVARNVEILKQHNVLIEPTQLWQNVLSANALSDLLDLWREGSPLTSLPNTVEAVLELIPIEAEYRGDIYLRAAKDLSAQGRQANPGMVP